MKRLVFSLLVCATGLAAQAQVTKLPEGFTSGKTVWMLRAGASLNGVTGDGVDAQKSFWAGSEWIGDFKHAFGGNLSFGFNKSFGKSPLYWGMELGATMRGYKTEASWESGARSTVAGKVVIDKHEKTQTSTLNAYNALLTPHIGYKVVFGEKMALDIHIGGYASYDIAGSFETKTHDYWSTISVGSGNTKITDNSNSVKIGDIDNYTKHDFGAIGGIGFWFGHFNVDVNYQRGFVSMFEGDNTYFCNKLQVRLGYAF